jgi:alkylation response protein AidB-like acyl-CoA dehydrogenase
VSMQTFRFDLGELPPEAEALRAEVRAFLRQELGETAPVRRAHSWGGFDREFSRKMGARGWIGMTWPKRYGGHERGALERYVVLEEMLAAGAPVSAHWIADRQSGPLLLRFGTEAQRQQFLPAIARGELSFAIGMSEPDSGSDLAATRTRAVPTADGYRVTGTKVWTTYAHKSHYMILFCRTSPGERHEGTSQLLVDLTLPGVTIRPIVDLPGEEHFNEVNFDDVLVPRSALLGREGGGWEQVMSELAFERSGPERFLSSFQLLVELLRALGPREDERARVAIGRLTAHLVVLRRLSRSVAGMLQKGENPALQAAVVKDLGTGFEQEIPEVIRLLIDETPALEGRSDLAAVLAQLMLLAPGFSIRGGTREILRGIIARGLGLR